MTPDASNPAPVARDMLALADELTLRARAGTPLPQGAIQALALRLVSFAARVAPLERQDAAATNVVSFRPRPQAPAAAANPERPA